MTHEQIITRVETLIHKLANTEGHVSIDKGVASWENGEEINVRALLERFSEFEEQLEFIQNTLKGLIGHDTLEYTCGEGCDGMCDLEFVKQAIAYIQDCKIEDIKV